MKRNQWVCVAHGGIWGDDQSCPKCKAGEPFELGPDGPDNSDRAEWARAAVMAYAQLNRHYEIELDTLQFDEIVGDLLGDLRHLADAVPGIKGETTQDWFDRLNDRGSRNYVEEIEEEASDQS